MEVVGNSIVYFGGQECYDAFEVAANEVERLLNIGRFISPNQIYLIIFIIFLNQEA